MEPFEGSLKSLRMTVDLLIYASVILGAILLVQLYGLVPSGLFYSVFIGWLLYLVVAIGASVGRELAYPSALALSILTLLVSIPRPEHYSLASGGLTVGAFTFIAGLAVQVGVIVTGGAFLLMKRRRSLGRTPLVREDFQVEGREFIIGNLLRRRPDVSSERETVHPSSS